jgi:hypothetical protein
MGVKAPVILKKRHIFIDWLTERGAEILQLANPYEIVRFRTSNGTSIIYQKANGDVTFCGESKIAWENFKFGGNWRAHPATKRKARNSNEINTLLDRDGDKCFYCIQQMQDEDITIEHLVSLTHGGPNHMSNMFLAHRLCNEAVGNLSAPEKIKIHVNMKIKRLGGYGGDDNGVPEADG